MPPAATQLVSPRGIRVAGGRDRVGILGLETSDEFKRENTFFRVNIRGHVFRLEGSLVKRMDATGQLPIALITHGTPGNSQNRLDTHSEAFLGRARDLARRGWLAAVVIRRGFGSSDGPMPAPASCGSTSDRTEPVSVPWVCGRAGINAFRPSGKSGDFGPCGQGLARGRSMSRLWCIWRLREDTMRKPNRRGHPDCIARG